MNWFSKFERKYSKYAIKNLMVYIIILYAVGFVFEVFAPGVYSAYLSLDFSKIFAGQVWRIVTFIIQPPSTSIIFVFFSLYFYYLIGTVLENIWGSFKFNVYFFSGVLLNIVAALIIYLIFGISFNMSTHYINLALFMAFAMEQPDMEVLLFFIIPIKIKCLREDFSSMGVRHCHRLIRKRWEILSSCWSAMHSARMGKTLRRSLRTAWQTRSW